MGVPQIGESPALPHSSSPRTSLAECFTRHFNQTQLNSPTSALHEAFNRYLSRRCFGVPRLGSQVAHLSRSGCRWRVSNCSRATPVVDTFLVARGLLLWGHKSYKGTQYHPDLVKFGFPEPFFAAE